MLCVVLFGGFGGSPAPASGFVNHTQHSDAQLWALGRARPADTLATNRSEPVAAHRERRVSQYFAGRSAGLGGQPRQIEVSSAPDVASAVLYAATGASRADPTGLISCPTPRNVNYAPAYSVYSHPCQPLCCLMGIFRKQFFCPGGVRVRKSRPARIGIRHALEVTHSPRMTEEL
jgi:hypothetical protein